MDLITLISLAVYRIVARDAVKPCSQLRSLRWSAPHLAVLSVDGSDPHTGLARERPRRAYSWSQFESVVAVTAAVALAVGCGVDLGCGVGYFAQAVEELIAPLE